MHYNGCRSYRNPPPPPPPNALPPGYEVYQAASNKFFEHAGEPGSVPPEPGEIPNLHLFSPSPEDLAPQLAALNERVADVEARLGSIILSA